MSILILRPNEDNSVQQASDDITGTNYSHIDEETLNESDYIHPSPLIDTLSKTDIYGYPNHTTESGTINSVTLKCYAKYVAQGDSNDVYVNPAVKIGSTVYNSGNQALTDSTALYSYEWTTNPATASAWSWAEIDDLLAGDTLTAHKAEKGVWRDSYLFQLWVEVDYTAGGGTTVKPHYYYLQQ